MIPDRFYFSRFERSTRRSAQREVIGSTRSVASRVRVRDHGGSSGRGEHEIDANKALSMKGMD